MKKIITSLFLLAFLSIRAQSVDRNDIVISVSPGVTLNYYQRLDSAGNVYSDPFYIGGRAPLRIEYVASRSFGLYADFVYTRLNVSSLYSSNFTVLDFGGGISLHSPSSKRLLNWFGHLGLQYSKLYFCFSGDILQQTTTANGLALYYDVGANIPLSQSQKFGVGICLNGSGYRYKNAKQFWDTGATSFFQLNGLASSVGLNLYYKL